ncbi:single-stranded DNA-binding protein [Allofustis seminis]|uniref:single-stranded DNA-binding protein n=1 Tax=Allofustis seminis TaxID=166939 RepID=UPI0003655256|nr:single-stranded DNA-binding protein [Allofustis seminis]
MNRTNVIGRIVRDIELKEVGEDRIVVNNTIAVPKVLRSKNGQEDADFIPFVAWDAAGKLLHEHCKKGDLIGLDGRMTSRTYVDKSAKTHYVVELTVERMTFLPNIRQADETNA